MKSTSSHFAYFGTYNPNGEGVYRVLRFSVDKASGKLSFVEGYTPMGSPSQMVFLPVTK